MIRFYICSPNRHDMVLVAGVALKILRRRGEAAQPVCLLSAGELLKTVSETELTETDILTCDVCAEENLPALEQLRTASRDMKLIVMADATVAPTSYLKPSILPTALLWKPVTEQNSLQTVGEVVAMVGESGGEQEEEPGFTVEVRGTLKRYSYREILYFEAREKKLWLHMQHKELSFTGTLEKLTAELPESFIRIHKSFIINRAHTVEVQYGQNLLQLSDGTMLPISRSYKADVKVVFS